MIRKMLITPDFKFYTDVAVEFLKAKRDSINTVNATGNGQVIITPATLYTETYDTTLITNIPSRLKVFWGQSSPEGDMCPNHTSGCAITAAAMAMTYWGFPESLRLTFDDRVGEIYSLDWDGIRNHNKVEWGANSETGNNLNNNWKYRELGCLCEEGIHTQIATLCREIGKRAQTEYKSEYINGMLYNSSGTTTTGIINTLKGLGYTALVREYVNLLNDIKISNTILLMEGEDTQFGGHMWVCDGAYCYSVKTHSWVSYDKGVSWEKNFDKTESYTYYFYNWGWNGLYNGLYRKDIFNPKEGTINSGYNFNKNVKYILMVK